MVDESQFIVRPDDVEREAIIQGLTNEEIKVPPIIMLTFNKFIIDELRVMCNLTEWDWSGGKFSPFYFSFKGWKGTIGLSLIHI